MRRSHRQKLLNARTWCWQLIMEERETWECFEHGVELHMAEVEANSNGRRLEKYRLPLTRLPKVFRTSPLSHKNRYNLSYSCFKNFNPYTSRMQYAFYSWNLINFELVMLNYNE
jgi:hypothetical protein